MLANRQPPPNRDTLHPKIRSSILRILSKKLSVQSEIVNTTAEDIALNAVILEYLDWIGFRHTADMFRRETKTPNSMVISEGKCLSNLVREKLQPSPVDDELPVIFSIIFKIKNRNSLSVTDKSII